MKITRLNAMPRSHENSSVPHWGLVTSKTFNSQGSLNNIRHMIICVAMMFQNCISFILNHISASHFPLHILSHFLYNST